MKKHISRIFGEMMNIKFPKSTQIHINKLFVKIFKIDLSEFKDIKEYKSLQEIFTRTLKKKRKFNANKTDFIAPTDSKIIQLGEIKNSTILQVKGVEYNINKFLSTETNQKNIKKLEDGNFINLYLSPKDYHHFHAPIDMYIQKIIHIPGSLFPVKESQLRKKEVFPINERVVLEFLSENNKIFYMVMIGALNVGNIKIFKEPKIHTNKAKNEKIQTYKYTNPLFMAKGEDIGCFNFGSSVVLLAEKNAIRYQDKLLNKKTKFGDTIGILIQ